MESIRVDRIAILRLMLLLSLAPSTFAQTAPPALRPAPVWGAPAAAPAASPPAAAPGVPAPRTLPGASAPLPKAKRRAELALVGLCWPSGAVGRGCGAVAGEPAERSLGLVRMPLQSGFHLELGSIGSAPPTSPRGARPNGTALDAQSCRQIAPIVVTIANVGDAPYEPVPGYSPTVGFSMDQGGQGGPNGARDVVQSLAPGESVTLRIGDETVHAGDYDVVLALYFNDASGRRRVEHTGRLRVRC